LGIKARSTVCSCTMLRGSSPRSSHMRWHAFMRRRTGDTAVRINTNRGGPVKGGSIASNIARLVLSRRAVIMWSANENYGPCRRRSLSCIFVHDILSRRLQSCGDSADKSSSDATWRDQQRMVAHPNDTMHRFANAQILPVMFHGSSSRASTIFASRSGRH
jgi:hypothetical protein